MQWRSWIQEQATEETFRDALICFDTNALLNMYRFPVQISQRYLDVIERLSSEETRAERNVAVWLPPQVVFEFVSNRPSAKEGAISSLNDAIAYVSSVVGLLDSVPEYIRAASLTKWQESAGKFSKPFLEALESQKNEIGERNATDPVLKALEPLLDATGRCVPSEEEAMWLIENAKERYHWRIPPGFADKNKSSKEGEDNPQNYLVFGHGQRILHSHGDLLIWKQILDEAIRRKPEGTVRLIIVTDESKEDWVVATTEGEMQHPLLTVEAGCHGLKLVLMSSSQFLEVGSRTAGLKVVKGDVETVQSVAIQQSRATDEFRAPFRQHMEEEVVDLVAAHLEGQGYEINFTETRGFDFDAIRGSEVFPTEVKYLVNPWEYHVYPIVEQVLRMRDEAPFRPGACQLFLVANAPNKLARIRRGLNKTVEKMGHVPLRIVIARLGDQDGDLTIHEM